MLTTASDSDRAAFAAAWQRAEEHYAFWHAHHSEIAQAYPDQFVAIHDGVVVGHGADLDVLVQQVTDAGLKVPDVWIEHTSTAQRSFIL